MKNKNTILMTAMAAMFLLYVIPNSLGLTWEAGQGFAISKKKSKVFQTARKTKTLMSKQRVLERLTILLPDGPPVELEWFNQKDIVDNQDDTVYPLMVQKEVLQRIKSAERFQGLFRKKNVDLVFVDQGEYGYVQLPKKKIYFIAENYPSILNRIVNSGTAIAEERLLKNTESVRK